MEQLVILVIIALVSLVNWLMQKSAQKREARGAKKAARQEVKRETRRNIYTRPTPERTTPSAPGTPKVQRDSFQELMEALGLPAEEATPESVEAEPDFFPEDAEFIPYEEAAPPPLPEPVVVRASPVPRREPPTRSPRPDRKTVQLASAFDIAEQQSHPLHQGLGLNAFLSDRAAQQKAVLLAEILGTPRGLAPMSALRIPGHL